MADGVRVLRVVFWSFCVAVLLIGVACVLVVAEVDEQLDPLAATGLAGLFGIGALAVGRRVERPLPCGSARELAMAYRTRFFLRLATSETAALVGFVLSVLAANPLPYGVGLVLTYVGFRRAAPSAGNLAAEQEALALAGCGHPLEPALRGELTRRT